MAKYPAWDYQIMDEIKVELLREEIDKLIYKLNQISVLENTEDKGPGEDLLGFVFDEHGVTYRTGTYFQGCGEEQYELEVAWVDVNKPIQYFKEKFQKEIEKWEKWKQEVREKEKERKIKALESELKRLKS